MRLPPPLSGAAAAKKRSHSIVVVMIVTLVSVTSVMTGSARPSPALNIEVGGITPLRSIFRMEGVVRGGILRIFFYKYFAKESIRTTKQHTPLG